MHRILRRAGVPPPEDTGQYLDLFHALAYAEDQAAQRRRLGMYGIGIDRYKDGRAILKDHLTHGGRISYMAWDDRTTKLHLGPEFDWGTVLAILTTHNTRGSSAINRWGTSEWERFEQCVDDKTPVTRALARDLGIGRSTIERLYRLHGLDPP